MMTEKEWVYEYLINRNDYWTSLVTSGRAPLEKLQDGPLKDAFLDYFDAEENVSRMIEDIENDLHESLDSNELG